MTQGIYLINNKCNGHQYIGQSVDIESRWKSHRYELNRCIHNNTYLQNAWNKYKEQNFSFSILERVKVRYSLSDKEQYWIERLQPVYNIAKNIYEWFYYKGELSNIPDGHVTQEETFIRPDWHAWVYGGARNPNLF